MARGSKFQIQDVDGLYYLFSENKGADQLHGYRAADLHLCFCMCEKAGFSQDAAHFANFSIRPICGSLELSLGYFCTVNINYAPNFEEVEEAYWFWPVRPSVCVLHLHSVKNC